MIKAINYEGIIKNLRNAILDNSELDANKVLNALSVRGTDLSDVINSTKLYSYSLCDTFLLYELLKDEAGENYVTKLNDDYMQNVSSYKFHIMIYGNGSDTCSQKIRAIFHQSSVLINLRENGVWVKNISSGESINEFVNNTLLLRNDLMLNIETVFESENKHQQEYFNQDMDFSDLNITVRNINNIKGDI